MATYTYTPGVGGILPEQYGALVDNVVAELSVATRVSTVVSTDKSEFHVPTVLADPSAAWVAEGDEIVVSDPQLAEIVTVPRKLAGMTIVSSEMAEDSSPAVADIIGRGLARDIAKKLDAAFFGALALPAPPGLGSITPTTVSGVLGTLDVFSEALAAVDENVGTAAAGNLTFVTSPADALKLATLKDQSGSNRPLLGAESLNGITRSVLGIPLVASPALTAGTGWLIPSSRVLVVMRQGTKVERSAEVYFSSDRVAFRATARYGFAFPHQAAVVRLDLS